MKLRRTTEFLRSGRSYSNLDYKRSRRATFYEIIMAQIVVVTISGPVLAGYLDFLGIDANVAAILMQVSMLGAAAQGIAPLFFMHRKNRLKLITLFFSVYRILNMCMIIPIFLTGAETRAWVFALISFAGYFTGYFSEPAWQEFLTGIVPLRMRGRFFGKWDASYIAAGAVYSLIAGAMLDWFRSAGLEKNGFLVLFAIAGLASILEISSFFLMKDTPVRLTKEHPPALQYLSLPLRDKSFRSSLKAVFLYNIAQNLALAYISLYPVSVLQLNYTFIAFATALGTFARVLTGPFWGKLADHKGWGLMLKYTTGLLGLSMLVFSFSSAQNAYILLPLANLMNGGALGGATFGFMTLGMSSASKEHRALYLGIYGAVASITGFASSLIGAGVGRLLESLSLPGGLHYMRILFLLSAVLFVPVALNQKKVLSK